MLYPYKIKKLSNGKFEGNLRDFGAKVKGETKEKITNIFEEAFNSIAEIEFRKKKQPIPLPSPPEPDDYFLYIPVRIQLRIILWNAMRAKKVSGAELARAMGVSRQEVQRFFTDDNPASVEKYEDALAYLGVFADVTGQEIKKK